MKRLLSWLFVISGISIFVGLPVYIWTENVFFIKLVLTSLILCVFTFIIIFIMEAVKHGKKENAYDVLAKIEKRQREEDEKNGTEKHKSKFMLRLEKMAKERGYDLPKEN